MKTLYYDRKYNFIYSFNTETGEYIRTGILKEDGSDSGIDPFMASFPHLIDVGIMGHCVHGQSGLCLKAGIECYQSGPTIQKPNMSLSDFESICIQCAGKTNQFALGGRGDPDQHENFKEILELCHKYNIVPNFTTSGYGLTKEKAMLCKQYCGAVAVSQYSRLKTIHIARSKNAVDWPSEIYFSNLSKLKTMLDNGLIEESNGNNTVTIYYESNEYTQNAIQMLLECGVKTNIHYVVGNQSINELLTRLKIHAFPDGINAVILLLHKPAGIGSEKNVLKVDDPRVAELYEAIEKPLPFKIGMDSCNVPGAINFCKNIAMESLDTCEGARFSCYISADMKMVPCSFDQENKYVCDLTKMSIRNAWNSQEFNDFRQIMKNSCASCKNKCECMGGCPLMPQIVLCKEKIRPVKTEN